MVKSVGLRFIQSCKGALKSLQLPGREGTVSEIGLIDHAARHRLEQRTLYRVRLHAAAEALEQQRMRPEAAAYDGQRQ